MKFLRVAKERLTVQGNVCEYRVCHSCSVFIHTGIVYDVLYCNDVL